MAKRNKRFADDGWAVWIEGEDTSTVYINDWLNPKGKSFVDFALRIVGINDCKGLHVYVPFAVTKDEIMDLSQEFCDKKILHATFGAACIVDYKKNKYTSEVAYNGKTVDIIHIDDVGYDIKNLSDGTVINLDLAAIKPYFDNDEVYLIWRMPHKSLDEIFKPRTDTMNFLERLRDLITSPVRFEKYGYSIRINESRLLPDEINKVGSFHRQKLKKTAVSLSISEDYELNDGGCYRIRRLEENLYQNYTPKGYNCEDIITYQWNQTRDHNLQGHFNFYFNISRESIGRASMTFYIILLVLFGVAGEAAYDLINYIIGLF